MFVLTLDIRNILRNSLFIIQTWQTAQTWVGLAGKRRNGCGRHPNLFDSTSMFFGLSHRYKCSYLSHYHNWIFSFFVTARQVIWMFSSLKISSRLGGTSLNNGLVIGQFLKTWKIVWTSVPQLHSLSTLAMKMIKNHSPDSQMSKCHQNTNSSMNSEHSVWRCWRCKDSWTSEQRHFPLSWTSNQMP